MCRQWVQSISWWHVIVRKQSSGSGCPLQPLVVVGLLAASAPSWGRLWVGQGPLLCPSSAGGTRELCFVGNADIWGSAFQPLPWAAVPDVLVAVYLALGVPAWSLAWGRCTKSQQLVGPGGLGLCPHHQLYRSDWGWWVWKQIYKTGRRPVHNSKWNIHCKY